MEKGDNPTYTPAPGAYKNPPGIFDDPELLTAESVARYREERGFDTPASPQFEQQDIFLQWQPYGVQTTPYKTVNLHESTQLGYFDSVELFTGEGLEKNRARIEHQTNLRLGRCAGQLELGENPIDWSVL